MGGADPIGGNVLYGDPMYSSDVFSGGPSNIARNCFLGIGGRASFTWGSKKRKLNKFYRHANTKHDNTGIASGTKFPYSTWKYYFYDYNDRRGLIHSSMFRREREVIRIFVGLLMLHSSEAFSNRGHPPRYPGY